MASIASAQETQSSSGALVLFLLAWFCLGLLGVLIGRRKNISTLGSFVGGLFGVFGLLVLLLLPKRAPDQERPSTADAIRTGQDAAKGAGTGAARGVGEIIVGIALFLYVHLRIAFVALSFLLIPGPLVILVALTNENYSDQLPLAVLMTAAGAAGFAVTLLANKHHI